MNINSLFDCNKSTPDADKPYLPQWMTLGMIILGIGLAIFGAIGLLAQAGIIQSTVSHAVIQNQVAWGTFAGGSTLFLLGLLSHCCCRLPGKDSDEEYVPLVTKELMSPHSDPSPNFSERIVGNVMKASAEEDPDQKIIDAYTLQLKGLKNLRVDDDTNYLANAKAFFEDSNVKPLLDSNYRNKKRNWSELAENMQEEHGHYTRIRKKLLSPSTH